MNFQQNILYSKLEFPMHAGMAKEKESVLLKDNTGNCPFLFHRLPKEGT